MPTKKSIPKKPVAKKSLVKRYLYINPTDALYALFNIANSGLSGDITDKAKKKLGEVIDKL